MRHLILIFSLWVSAFFSGGGGGSVVPLGCEDLHGAFKSWRQYNGPSNDDYSSGEVVGMNIRITKEHCTDPGEDYVGQGYIDLRGIFGLLNMLGNL